MNKLQTIILGMMIFGSTQVCAQEYVRKAVRPSFFIPEKEFDRQEKLPPIPVVKKNSATKHTRKQSKVNNPKKETDYAYATPPINDVPENKSLKHVKEPKAYLADDGYKKHLVDDANYQKIIKAYEQDLKTMKKTGEMPDNPRLESDLQKMNSDASFAVEFD